MEDELFEIEDGVLTHFYDLRQATKVVTVPDGVTAIGETAFADNNVIEKVILPESVKEIGESAFTCCWHLKEINVPAGCKIGEGAFMGTSLQAFDFEKVSELSETSFWDCPSLQSAILPEGLKEIPDDVFLGCMALAEVKIPSTVKRIGERAFCDCENLYEVILPDNVEEVGTGAFSDCKGIKEIYIPASVTKTGFKIFKGCKDIAVYCAAAEKPEGWHADWDVIGGLFKKKRCKVIWGFKSKN